MIYDDICYICLEIKWSYDLHMQNIRIYINYIFLLFFVPFHAYTHIRAKTEQKKRNPITC